MRILERALVYVKTDSFMFSFDLHAAYHHVEMLYPHELLGFSWVVNGKQKYSAVRVKIGSLYIE